MRELLEAPNMEEGERKTPRPHLNRCAVCKQLAPELVWPDGFEIKGKICPKCEWLLGRQRALGTVCVHGRPKAVCRKKVCLIAWVMSS